MRYQNLEEFKTFAGYEINGAWFPRVTKILEIKAKPGLEKFFRDVGDYDSAESIKMKSAQEGTLIHALAEDVLSGKTSDIPDAVRPAIEALIEFQHARSILVFPEFVERRLWSERYRYTGTVDALAMIDGRIGVLDIKTSNGFYPEFHLQTAAYVAALQELPVRNALGCSFPVETRWILRVNQHAVCLLCKATKRLKGGRETVRENGSAAACKTSGRHEWSAPVGDIELREFPRNLYKDMRAFLGAKALWEWENDYWLRQVGYVR